MAYKFTHRAPGQVRVIRDGTVEWETPIDRRLSKREVFAMAAMQGIVSGFTDENKVNGCYIPEYEYPGLMSQAVQLADELLKQLEK